MFAKVNVEYNSLISEDGNIKYAAKCLYASTTGKTVVKEVADYMEKEYQEASDAYLKAVDEINKETIIAPIGTPVFVYK
jgi:ectoine hydroxylase-related dioxygenase (phytanoyl-CoA dioxygenase family)